MKKFAWSYSALTQFETCARQYYHLRVKKDIVEAPSPQMQDGNRQHKMLELRIKDGTPLPSDMRDLEPLMRRIERIPATLLTEQKIALTADLKPTTYFAKDVWLRGVLDLTAIKGTKAHIIDYKTGKRKPDSDQLELFAGMAMAQYPELVEVKTSFWWLKSKETDRDTFTRDDTPRIWRKFTRRAEAMEEAIATDTFPPTESGLCHGWCPVKTCEHWRPKKNRD